MTEKKSESYYSVWAGLFDAEPYENVENLVAGPGEDKFADHPQPPSDRPSCRKTKAVVVTGIKKNSEFGPRLRRG